MNNSRPKRTKERKHSGLVKKGFIERIMNYYGFVKVQPLNGNCVLIRDVIYITAFADYCEKVLWCNGERKYYTGEREFNSPVKMTENNIKDLRRFKSFYLYVR